MAKVERQMKPMASHCVCMTSDNTPFGKFVRGKSEGEEITIKSKITIKRRRRKAARQRLCAYYLP